jgi:hypothetical protein
LRNVQIEIRLHRLWWDIHRQIDLDCIRGIVRRARCRLGHESAASNLGLDQSAPARFAVGTRHRCQIEIERRPERDASATADRA